MPDDHSGLVADAAIQGFSREGLAAFNAQFHQLGRTGAAKPPAESPGAGSAKGLRRRSS